jgi:hypothetical protein
MDEHRRPEPREQEAECPQDVRARPLEIRSKQRESRDGEQHSRRTPAGALEGDDGRGDEGPRQREVGGDARSRDAFVDAEPADPETGSDDGRDE